MIITKRTVFTAIMGVQILIGCSLTARAEFFIRPLVHYSLMTDHDTVSAGAFGAGIAVGGAFGKEGRFEAGAEISRSRFNGYYSETTYSGIYANPVGYSTQRYSATYTVTPVQATFRYTFATRRDALRPYVGVVAGFTHVDLDERGEETSGDAFTGGIGTGVSYRIGQTTCLNAGYQYLHSGVTSRFLVATNIEFHYDAHVFTLAIDQRF